VITAAENDKLKLKDSLKSEKSFIKNEKAAIKV
jgi:hypothetical protein